MFDSTRQPHCSLFKGLLNFDQVVFAGHSAVQSVGGHRGQFWCVWVFCVCPHACLPGGGRGVYISCCRGNKCWPSVDGRVCIPFFSNRLIRYQFSFRTCFR